MNERLFDFFDDVLQRNFGSGVASYPRMRQHDVEILLTDDARWRLLHGRRAAVEWGNHEHLGDCMITSELVLITDHGLVYSAVMRAGKARRPLYYLATPPSMFESIVAGVSTAPLRPESAAAVDNRLGHDLEFPWPLDHALRRMLATNPVLRMEPSGSL